VPERTASTFFSYDKNGNLLSRREQDWQAYSTDTMETAGADLRETRSFYYAVTPDAAITSTDMASYPDAYWQPHNPAHWTALSSRRLNALARQEICTVACAAGAAVKAVSEFAYDDPFTRGNITVEKRWDSQKSAIAPAVGALMTVNSVTVSRIYDSAGNLTDIYEPTDIGQTSVRTKITYDSDLYPIRVDYAYGTLDQRTWTYSWNNTAGILLATTDADNMITTTYSYDDIGRRKTTNEAGLRQTRIIYDEQNHAIVVHSDLSSFGDERLQSIRRYDQLGRVALVQMSDGAPLNSIADGIKMKTVDWIAANGRRVVVSAPYRNLDSAETTLEWTCTQYDLLGRVTAVATFNGPTQPTDCDQTSNRTGITTRAHDVTASLVRIRITDPAGNNRDEYPDALGRLFRVTDALSHTTMYAHDALDNLTAVSQSDGVTTQGRSFLYSSLGRLITAMNPETGTITYDYRDDGNLRSRTDGRGTAGASYTVTFGYDDLHRLRSKTYLNDGGLTPAVTYEYHQVGSAASPNIGRIRIVSSAAASTIYDSYDRLGRPLSIHQTITGVPSPLLFSYTYWVNDGIKTALYPSGKQVHVDLDNAGRPNKIWAQMPSSLNRTYADLTPLAVTDPYTADGRVARMKLGNDLFETRDYRPAGTATTLKLGTAVGSGDTLELQYNYSSNANNGNLQTHVIKQSGKTWTQKYTYDHLNRLTCVGEAAVNSSPGTCPAGAWHQTFGYDAFGNRWVASSFGLNGVDVHEPGADVFDRSTNRMNTVSYDQAGNQTAYNPYTLAYDVENRLVSVTSAGNGNGTFVYDGDGRRVKKTWTPSGGSTTTTYYVYDVAGQLAAEYSADAPAITSTSYAFTDLIGSVRALTGQKPSSGPASILECYDHVPFGRLLRSDDNQRNTGCYPANPDYQLVSRTPQKFSGKERDVETGLDFSGARYFSAAEGRFISPDPPLIDQHPSDSQSWNLYNYVRNNPLTNIDPTGQDCIYTDDIDSDGTVGLERGSCSRKRGTFIDGTVDAESLAFDSRKRSLGYTYSRSTDTIGTGTIGLGHLRTDELDAKGLAFVTGMAARVDASNEAIALFSAGTALAGVGGGAYPVAAQAVNELAFGPATGRLFFAGRGGYELAKAYGIGRLIADSPLGQQYENWGKPLGTFGWQLLSRFWASGASGTVNIFPSFTNPQSILWKTELPMLLRNPNVFRIWH
jgi:RHS repeat-associated protein